MRLAIILLLFSQNVLSNDFLIPKISKKASFSQKRYIKSSNIYLFSRGILHLTDEGGLVWAQKEPFIFKMIIEKGKIYNIEGSKRVEVENTSALMMSNIIYELLNGNIKPLKEKFNFKRKGREIYILPIDNLLKKVVKEILVVGDAYIEKFTLKEMSGNFLELNITEYESSSVK